jgi:hypothetical protein
MKTRNDIGASKQRHRCPVAAFRAEPAHEKKKAPGVGVTR